MGIHAKFVVEYGFSKKQLETTGGWSVLSEALPLIRSKTEATEWLDKAGSLSLRDMRKSVIEAQRGAPGCKHKNTGIIRFHVCHDCGDKERIYD